MARPNGSSAPAKHGEEAAMRDLRELKLSLGDSRKIINQLKIGN